MKIISIKKKNKATTNCIVSLVNELNNDSSIVEIELSMDIIVQKQLKKDKIIDDIALKRLQTAQRLINAKQVAYSFAAKANKTQQQVVQKLQSQGFCAKEIDLAIHFLQEFNLIDDSLFAKKYIKDTLLTKNIGKTGLLTKLISKGIDKHVAEQAIAQHYPIAQSNQMLCDVVQKKIRSLTRKNISPAKLKSSLFNHILSKGFTFEEAKKAIRQING